MNPSDTIDVLGRLVRILCRSLPIYLESARPFPTRDTQAARDAVASLAADEQLFTRRVAGAIRELGGPVELGHFPLRFTSIHDLDVPFLLKEVVEHHRRDVAAIEDCTRELVATPPLQSLAEEILGNARGHLESLEALTIGV
jgi:hypothetical protein